jgi:hypothetical protein
VVNADELPRPPEAMSKPLSRQHFTSAYFECRLMISISTRDPGEGSMFDQTISGTLRNLAIGLVLTAAVVGAGFALAFS